MYCLHRVLECQAELSLTDDRNVVKGFEVVVVLPTLTSLASDGVHRRQGLFEVFTHSQGILQRQTVNDRNTKVTQLTVGSWKDLMFTIFALSHFYCVSITSHSAVLVWWR